MTRPEDFAPLHPILLVTHDASWSVIYSTGGPEYHLHAAALDRHGIEGSGYDFSGALRAVLTDAAPDALAAVGFDPEGGMLSVYGTDLDALLVAATHLHRIVMSEADLDAALTRAVELGVND